MTRLAGASLDHLAATFGIERTMIWRHMRDHVSAADKAAYIADIPVQEMVARAAAEGVSLLDYVKIVRASLVKQFHLAVAVNDSRAVAALAGKLHESIELGGRLSGEMLRSAPGSTITNNTVFINSPLFADLQLMLMRKLQGYPEALSRVVAGLQELEARAAPLRAESMLTASAAPSIDMPGLAS
jgi:hypothetical protein